ncbi:glycosyltransferase family 4 protein [Paraflavitalea soli]|nr:glycosyltransferase family 4 protein [Paraflavitalea soli]
MIKVFYTWEQSKLGENFDPGFGQIIEWDIPLLGGYEYSFVKNVSPDPGTHKFKGIVNPDLKEELTEWAPDALFVFGWSFDSHLKCLRYFHGKIPILFRGDSTLLDEQEGLKKILRRIFLKWVYRHIDIALYTGTNNKAYFEKHGLRNGQLVFAPHAIDNSRFADVDGTYSLRAKEWRAQLGFTQDDIVVLFAGKLEPKKDPGILLKLARIVKNSRLKFLLVGNGKLENDLKKEAASLENVRFLDFQNQQTMPVVYRLGDIFVLPSVGPGETWGLALNEAMASGLPVLASDKVGGAVDLIQQGQNGYIFPHGNVEQLHKHLLNISTKPALMGQHSEEIIRSWNFSAIVNSIQSTLIR